MNLTTGYRYDNPGGGSSDSICHTIIKYIYTEQHSIFILLNEPVGSRNKFTGKELLALTIFLTLQMVKVSNSCLPF